MQNLTTIFTREVKINRNNKLNKSKLSLQEGLLRFHLFVVPSSLAKFVYEFQAKDFTIPVHDACCHGLETPNKPFTVSFLFARRQSSQTPLQRN